MVKLPDVAAEHETLKLASLNDIPEIMGLAERLYDESPYGIFKLDRAKVRQNLEKFIIEGSPNHLVLVSHDAGKPVGVLAAYAYEPLFSKERCSIEVLWYLTPEYRTQGRRGVEMMEAYEYWAKLVGVSVVHYGLLETGDERQARLYERHGMTQIERTYQKVLV